MSTNMKQPELLGNCMLNETGIHQVAFKPGQVTQMAPTREELDYLPDRCFQLEYVAITGYFFIEVGGPVRCKLHESHIIEAMNNALRKGEIDLATFWHYADTIKYLAQGWWFSDDCLMSTLDMEINLDIVSWMCLHSVMESIVDTDFRAVDGYARYDPGLAFYTNGEANLGLQFARVVSTEEEDAWIVSILDEAKFFDRK